VSYVSSDVNVYMYINMEATNLSTLENEF